MQGYHIFIGCLILSRTVGAASSSSAAGSRSYDPFGIAGYIKYLCEQYLRRSDELKSAPNTGFAMRPCETCTDLQRVYVGSMLPSVRSDSGDTPS